MALSWLFLLLLIFSNIVEGSVDHIIYRDYIVNRRSFIYCSLATGALQCPLTEFLCCQLSVLFPTRGASVVGILNGAFDTSSGLVPLLIKVGDLTFVSQHAPVRVNSHRDGEGLRL